MGKVRLVHLEPWLVGRYGNSFCLRRVVTVGTNAPRVEFMRRDDGRVRKFSSRVAAERHLRTVDDDRPVNLTMSRGAARLTCMAVRGVLTEVESLSGLGFDEERRIARLREAWRILEEASR